MKRVEVAVIGGGAAGLAAAVKLAGLGIEAIALFDRNPSLGGILPQCIHPGFGLQYFGEELTGPEYARRLVDRLHHANVHAETNANVAMVDGARRLEVAAPSLGRLNIHPRALILATGCRERTRENLEIPGTRPAGIFTAGQAQTLVNILGLRIGRRVVIQGSGDIGLIMARRLTIEGYEVVEVLERLPYLSGSIRNKVQCLDAFGIPLRFDSEIAAIQGRNRVERVQVREGLQERTVDCDTVLFASGLIPEVPLTPGSINFREAGGLPRVNSRFEGTQQGVFICGNALHIHELADDASLEGERVAEEVVDYLANPTDFRKRATAALPYRLRKTNTRYNSAFFADLSGKTVCTVCPRGCTEPEDQARCRKAGAFSEPERRGLIQYFTSTIPVDGAQGLRRLAIRSSRKLDVRGFRELKRRLDSTAALDGGRHEAGELSVNECDNEQFVATSVANPSLPDRRE